MRDSHLMIVPYSPMWPQMFQQERERLLAAVGEFVETIEHVGSTAVPGLAAKPVIDIMIGVSNLREVEQPCITAIEGLGYEYVQWIEAVMPERRYFRKSDASGMRTHQIHLWQIDNPEYDRHIVFRDYLRAHPEEAAAYAAVKRELIGQFDDVNDYAEAKSAFILPCQERAYAWRERVEAQKDGRAQPR